MFSHSNSHDAQGNRVLTEEDLKQVILPPTSLRAFALNAHFEGGFPFQ